MQNPACSQVCTTPEGRRKNEKLRTVDIASDCGIEVDCHLVRGVSSLPGAHLIDLHLRLHEQQSQCGVSQATREAGNTPERNAALTPSPPSLPTPPASSQPDRQSDSLSLSLSLSVSLSLTHTHTHTHVERQTGEIDRVERWHRQPLLSSPLLSCHVPLCFVRAYVPSA